MKNNTFCVSKKGLFVLFIILILASLYFVFNSSQNMKLTLNSKAAERRVVATSTPPQTQTIPNCQTLSDAYKFDNGIKTQIDRFAAKYQCGALKLDGGQILLRPYCSSDSMCIHEMVAFNIDNTKCLSKSLLTSNNPLATQIYIKDAEVNSYKEVRPDSQNKYNLTKNQWYYIFPEKDQYLLASRTIRGTLSCGNNSQQSVTKTVSVDNNDKSYYSAGQVLDLSGFIVECKYTIPGSFTASSDLTANDYNGNIINKIVIFNILVR